jgi:hypothetical protein
LPRIYWVQVAAIILTLSTLSFGAVAELVLELAPGALVLLELELPRSSSVPVTSTLCPTWGVSLLSSPSSLYMFPAEADAEEEAAPAPAAALGADELGADELGADELGADDDEPDVPVAFIAFARMNFGSLLLLLPVVPVAPGVALDAWAAR